MTNDDPFQYFGGIGLAVRHLDGKSPEMYVSNLRKKDQLKAQTLEEFVNQEMRSRYFHPRWIQAMQDSGYAGATAILDRMNNMWGWEVMVPEAIRDDQWQEFFEVYVEDKYQMNMDAFFKEHNAEALAQIIERMVEAIRKGYWQTDDKTKKKLVETYTELAATYDVATDNKKFSDFVDQQAQGFGLTPLSVALAQMTAQKAQAATPAQTQTEQISGQKLEEQNKTQVIETDYTPMYWLMFIFLIGGLSNMRPPKRFNKSAASFIKTDGTVTKKAA
jgi:cobaltochelatase CobN